MESRYIVLILALSANLYLANGMTQMSQRFKPINQSLTLTCHCEEASLCKWYYQDQLAVPDHWVQANGNLYLPADDWTVYGGITHQCGSDSNIHTVTVMNTGEDCYTCLQLFTSSVKDFCVGSVANVTISTNRSHSHGDAITLYVNGNVCSSTHHGNGVVRCREHGSVVGHTLSYTITAIDDGMVTMRAHTNHYGANWYSTTVIITAVDQCLLADRDINNGTNVTTTTPTSDDVITTDDPTSSEEMPTSSTDDGSSVWNAVPEQSTPIVNISGNMEDDEYYDVIAAVIVSTIIAIIIVIVIVIYCCWKCYRERKNFEIDQQDQQPAHVSLLRKLITGLPSCSNSSQESPQDYCC